MTFAVGSLVRARGREWVVQPASEGELLVLRPLGGSDAETTGVYLPLETVEAATFDPPAADDLGDFHSCRRLRDAARLANRNSAGPFRSAGNLKVEPRPYQLVPLLLALRQDPVRLLIADDVGIGKTVEACLIARELLDRGEIQRLCVLCPPHLAEQWRDELADKFNLTAELLLPATVSRLERHLGFGQSLYQRYPFLVVSTDYIKSDRRRRDFLRACPEMVIVDEAHTCVPSSQTHGTVHQRYKLLRGLAEDPDRHLVLVTATPHSGRDESFRNLLSLLSPDLAELPQELTGPENEPHRRRLSEFFVQRRRGDISDFLGEGTPFPVRQEPDKEPTYALHPAYRTFFDKVLRFARETVQVEGEDRVRQRVRWWSALALLRSVSSSPAAAATTLRSRAQSAGAETAQEADELGRRAVLDLSEEDSFEGGDVTPGAHLGDEDAEVAAAGEGEGETETGVTSETSTRRRLLALAREVEALTGAKDRKLTRAAELIQGLLDDGFRPIVFCRFIATAEYVAEQLRDLLDRAEVAAVTGLLPPAEREKRVLALGDHERPVLVCTDCLSEGINLQHHFDAVFHYDLSWNPTRHEQREGRVDRFGQQREAVRVLTYYGSDNPIDGIVLDVLLRKHKAIRSSLGIAVPVPTDTDKVVQAIFEGLLLRESTGPLGLDQMALFEDLIRPQKEQLHDEWEEAAQRHEVQSRTMYAQQRIRPEEVLEELQAARRAVGSGDTVRRFTLDALRAHGAAVSGDDPYTVDFAEAPLAVRDRLPVSSPFRTRFELPVDEGVEYLHRTHPVVQGLAEHVFDTALDPQLDGIAHRAGVIRTAGVDERTVLLLVRLRYQLHLARKATSEERPLLAEEVRLVAFAGEPEEPEWLDDEAARRLLTLGPDVEVPPDQKTHFLRRILDHRDLLEAHLEGLAETWGGELLAAHQRVRKAAKARGGRYRVEPKLPVDVLGLYLYLPAPSAA